MFARAIALGLSLAVVSVAHAQVAEVEVVLVATPDLPSYAPGDMVLVEVFLQRAPTASDMDPRDLRMVQLDFNASDSLLALSLPTIHTLGTPGLNDDIRFWFFGTLGGCPTNVSPTCGDAHFIEDELAGSRAGVVAIAYLGNLDAIPPDLGPNAALQLTLPGDGTPLKVGELDVTLPMDPGTFTLDLLNTTQTNPDIGGAEVRFGFEIPPVDPTPLTVWRAPVEVTGGTLTFNVGPICPHGINLVAAATKPTCDVSLPWASNSVIRLTFGSPVILPAAGEVEIRELLDGIGMFGASDLSGMFSFSLEAGDTVLRIEENGTVLNNGTWYGILNTGGWCDPELFEVTFPMLRGDANDDGFVNFFDLNFIFASVPSTAADNDPSDINRDGFVNFFDLNDAFSFLPSSVPAKPTGHACAPAP